MQDLDLKHKFYDMSVKYRLFEGGEEAERRR
jgi:hypothetical protein